MENTNNSSNIFKDLIPLFSVEIVLLTMMNFAGLITIYRLMAMIVMMVCFVPIIKSLPKNKAIISIIGQTLCLLIFETITITSGLSSSKDFMVSFSTIIGGLSFYLIGAYHGISKEKSQLLNIASIAFLGIGIYALICIIATIYGMGTPFHTMVFSGTNFANRAALKYKARLLFGFTTVLVSNGVYILSNFAFIAATGLILAFFIDRKKHPFSFYASLIGGLFGLTTLFLIPMLLPLVAILIAVGFVAIIRLPLKKKKAIFISFSSIAGAVILFYLIFRIAHRFNAEYYDTHMNPYLREALTTKISFINNLKALSSILKTRPKFIGTPFELYNEFKASGNFFFDTLYQSGILAGLGILGLFAFALYEYIMFVRSKVDITEKVAISTLLISYVMTITLNYVGFILIDDFVFLPIILIIGYMTMKNIESKKVKIVATQESSN